MQQEQSGGDIGKRKRRKEGFKRRKRKVRTERNKSTARDKEKKRPCARRTKKVKCPRKGMCLTRKGGKRKEEDEKSFNNVDG